MNTESKNERLYDCIITYHLINGQNLSESYRKDVPDLLWAGIKEDYCQVSDCLELTPSDAFAKVLIPKSNISYISLKVLCSTN